MNNLKIFLILMPFLQSSGKLCSRSNKPLQMIVLYESLCSDSQVFFKKFLPAYMDYQNCINLTLVPHGKSWPANRGYQCQHGKPECWGNRMQNCALHSNLTQLQQMNFIGCQMKDFQLTVRKDFKCAKSLKIVKSVRNCMKSNTSYQLRNAATRITEKYPFSEIPAIIYNNEFDGAMQEAFRTKVRQTLCNILVKTKLVLPEDCKPYK